MITAGIIVGLSVYHIHIVCVCGISLHPSRVQRLAPVWSEWRYGPPADRRLSKGKPGAWKAKVAALDSNQVSDTEYKKCAEIAKQPPIPDQIVKDGSFGGEEGLEEGLEIALRFAKAAQHVFVLCVDCKNFKVPAEIADKISLVDGMKSDECLRPETLQHWPSKSYLQHLVKTTLAHKLIAWTALEMEYSSIAVVEEDVQGWPDFERPGALNQFYTDAEVARLVSRHPFIRLGYIPDTWDNCKNACQRATGENSACSMKGPYLAPSSIMYIASGADTYKSFIATSGCIDITLFETLAGAVKMTFLLPPVVYHPDPIWGNQTEIYSRFTSECVG